MVTTKNTLKDKLIDKSNLLIISFIIIAIALSILFYNKLPETIATHWGINGEANGFMGKTSGLIIFPAIMIILSIVLYYLPKLDPLNENIKKFRKDYNVFITILIAVMLYIHIITLSINLGINLDLAQFLSPALAILFYAVGILLSKAKRNFFIGLRTPWTLSSEIVWNKTHKLGAKLFKCAGIICLLGIILPAYAIFFIIIPIIFFSIWMVIYSFLEYSKLKKK